MINCSDSVDCVADGHLYDMGAAHLVTLGCYGDSGWTEDKASYDIGWNHTADYNDTWNYTPADGYRCVI